MTVKIETIDDYIGRLFLFIGPSGSGKSTLAKHLNPETLFIAYDPDGINAVRPVDAILVDRERAWPHTQEILSYLARPSVADKYNTIVWDDLTATSRMFLHEVTPAARRDKPQIQDYGPAINRLRTLVDQCKFSLTQFVHIFIATDLRLTDEEDKITFTLPNVLGKDTFASELPAMVDNVFYVLPPRRRVKIMGNKKEYYWERKILTSTEGIRLAKNRVNVLDKPQILELEEEVNFEELRKKIWGVRSSEKDKRQHERR